MNWFTRAAATSQQLSIIAMQEASRQGLREADLDHLLLALVISEQSAGQALRRLGVTLPAARAAVDAQHAAQLASIGIGTPRPDPGPIVFHETSGYDWTPRARDLIVHSADKKKRGDAAAVLRDLLAEPSGLITHILQRLDTTPGAVLDTLAAVERADVADSTAESSTAESRAAETRSAASLDGTSVTLTAFVPAPAEEVWTLINDPLRLHEWHPAVGRVDAAPLTDTPPQWTGYAHTTRPDGKPLRMREQYARRIIRRVSSTPHTSVIWLMSLPDAVRAPDSELTINLASAEGGTTLRLTEVTQLPRGWRRVVGLPFRPLRRFLGWITLSAASGGVSRAFRS